MYVKDSDAHERLLEAGKQEFLQHGYAGASLRRICKNAGVTTGAVYSCFENKEDIFCQIVGGTVDELKHMMYASCERECSDAAVAIDDDVEVMTYLWHNREVVMLLFDGAQGTRYEGIFEELMQIMTKLFARFFRHYAGTDIDDRLLSIIVKSRVYGQLEILRCSKSLEQAAELERNMSLYSNTGFKSLITNAKNEDN